MRIKEYFAAYSRLILISSINVCWNKGMKCQSLFKKIIKITKFSGYLIFLSRKKAKLNIDTSLSRISPTPFPSILYRHPLCFPLYLACTKHKHMHWPQGTIIFLELPCSCDPVPCYSPFHDTGNLSSAELEKSSQLYDAYIPSACYQEIWEINGLPPVSEIIFMEIKIQQQHIAKVQDTEQCTLYLPGNTCSFFYSSVSRRIWSVGKKDCSLRNKSSKPHWVFITNWTVVWILA